jgi:hypothetical protein
MSIRLHDGCREMDDSGAFCKLDRDHDGETHYATTPTGLAVWTRRRSADVTPPLRRASRDVPDVQA